MMRKAITPKTRCIFIAHTLGNPFNIEAVMQLAKEHDLWVINAKLIETRNLFAGNITKQPGFMGKNWRIADHLNNTDYIMNNTFFLGTYPGLTKEMFDYCEGVLTSFIQDYTN